MQEKQRLKDNAVARKPISRADILPSEETALSKFTFGGYGKMVPNELVLPENEQKQLDRTLFRDIEHGSKTEIRQAIWAGADITAHFSSGETLLHRAAQHGRTQACAIIMEEYAKAGGDVKDIVATHDFYASTPLQYAAEYGQTETCALLIEKGADINAIDQYGRTALSYAEQSGNKDTVAFLKLAVAVPNIFADWKAASSFYSSFEECIQ